MTNNPRIPHGIMRSGDGSVIAMSHALDAGSAERVNGGIFGSTLGAAMRTVRFDGRVVPEHARALMLTLSQQGRKIDAMAEQLRGDGTLHADAVSPTGGLLLRENLEHVYAEVLTETVAPNNALRLFPIDRSVAAGARTHKVSRKYHTGDAKVYRGGMDIPRVGVQQATSEFPIRHYVSSFAINVFEALSAGFANVPLASELLRACRDVLDEFLNLMTWFGSTVDGLFGVLSYPWMPLTVSSVTFDGSVPADELDEISSIADEPFLSHEAVVSPDSMITSPRMLRRLARTRFANSDESVLQRFLADHPAITKVETARELQGTGPGGTDGVIVHKKGRRGIQNVVSQGFTLLPAQSQGFEQITYAYMSHGGIVLRDPFSTLLAWVDVVV